MNIDHELLYLVSKGQLPIQAVDPALLPGSLQPALKSMQFMLDRGDTFPLELPNVWRLAEQRFNGKEDCKLALKLVSETKFHGPMLESVRDSLVLRRVIQQASEQIANGSYDLRSLMKMLDVTGDQKDRVRLVGKGGRKQAEYLVKSGIPQIDELVGGFNAELVVMAARPKAGKSNFFANLIWKTPQYRTVYVTVADYDYDDFCLVLNKVDSSITERENLYIVDFTTFSSTVADVESVVNEVKPHIVIVDRSEKLTPLRRRKEPRWELTDIFDALRRTAKKHKCPVFTDSQVSAEGEREASSKSNRNRVPYTMMAEDRTGRAAIMDLFFGMSRESRTVYMTAIGRRTGLPQMIEITADSAGRYKS